MEIWLKKLKNVDGQSSKFGRICSDSFIWRNAAQVTTKEIDFWICSVTCQRERLHRHAKKLQRTDKSEVLVGSQNISGECRKNQICLSRKELLGLKGTIRGQFRRNKTFCRVRYYEVRASHCGALRQFQKQQYSVSVF